MPAAAANSPAGIALPSESALTIASRAGSLNAAVIRENPDCTDRWIRAIQTPAWIIPGFGRSSFQNLMKHKAPGLCDAGQHQRNLKGTAMAGVRSEERR